MSDEATPLLPLVQNILNQRRNLSIGEYMALCLGHPQHGYYMTREPFGAQGDFTTAPEISQLFGEMLAVWVATTWEKLGKPDDIQLVELGPGRGTLMKDIWRGLKAVPHLRDILKIHLVEFSPRLRNIQEKTLEGLPVSWHEHLEAVPEQLSLIIANEFFDALPIDQAMHHQGNWYRRMITAAEEDMIFSLGGPLQGIFVEEPKDGDIFEYAPMAADVMQNLCDRLALNGGALLAIDYGDDVPLKHRVGDTLQALYQHKPISVLEKPGLCDITAHVAFAALHDIAAESGCTAAPLLTQREFLTQLGIRLRAEKLLTNATDEQRATLQSGLNRLIDPAEMGDLFKVLEVYA